ncbi:MAG: TonB-dependent receptor [Bacteroidales bacterium]|nr:TonB-dependent receptor [Bacteroidales bacterium]
MRKTVMLTCMLLSMLLSSLLYAQEEPVINFPKSRMTLSEALKTVEQLSGYSIAYNEDLLDLGKTVSVPSGKKLTQALSLLLEGTACEARIKDRMILIVRKQNTESTPQTYSGKVFDKDGPVIGAVLVVEESKEVATTGVDGSFSIPARKGDVLLISMMGYKEVRMPLGSQTDKLSIRLLDDITLLEESVVVGYGTMQRRDITSAIATYKPAEEGERQVLSPDAMLQGRVPGVNVTAASGTPGGKSRVSIRGIGSLTAGNEPLYVIDGIPMSNTSGDTGAWGGESLSGLSDINPADIESVQVLKDAASAAIYGSRGTNGVIIITTKKGTKGAPKLSADANFGLSYLPNLSKLKVADADLYLEVQNEAIDNYNMQTGSSIARLENPYPGKPQFSWLDMVFRVAKSWSANVSVSGGSENSNYYVSASAKQNEGVGIGSLYEKYGVKANVNSDVRRWLSVGASLNFSYTNANRVPDGSIGTSMLTHGLEHRPWDTPFKPDGSYTIINAELLHYNLVQAINEQNVYNKSYRAYGSVFARINFSKDLHFKTSFGGDIMAAEDHVQYTADHMYGNSVGVLIDSRKNFTSIVVDNILDYSHTFGGLSLSAMLGHSFQLDNNSTAYQKGQGFPSKSFDVNSVAAEFTDVTTGLSTWGLQSFMFRTTVNWKDRYLVTVNARYDGSSKFAPEHRYGFFPSVSLGWNLSEEPFWQFKTTNAKLRVSYGATGNQGGIGSYAYQSLANGGYNYMNKNGLAVMTQGNRELEWEKADQYDIGTDLSFFSGALTFTVDAFLKDTRNLLYSKPTAATTGFTNYTCNIGSMRNKGLEFAVGGNLGKHDFHWKGDFNISFVRNKLTSLIGEDEILRTDDYHALKVGEEVGSFYMIKMLGIYQSDEEVPTYLYENYGVRAGDVIYEDVSGPNGEPDGDINSAYDSQFVGSPNPKFTGGFNNSFTYKGLDFNVFFTFSYGSKLYEYWTGGLRLGNGNWPAQESEALARWTGPGTTNTTPRAIYGYTWNSTMFKNTRFLHDASYLRLRSVSLGYTLPKNLTKRIGVDKLRIYVQGDNVWLLSPFRFLDPEVNTSLNATKMGLDCMWIPQPRSFTFGINLKF